jgi:ATP-dependent DNA helicase RecG
MGDDELERLLTDLESDRVERKESLSDPERIRQAVCAFANDLPGHGQPGVVFVGARDDGSCAGLAITDQLLRTLADMRSDGNILPIPSMLVEKRTLLGCEMAVVIVQPQDAPPVRCRGRTWIRVGPRRAIATPEEERRLNEKRRARELPFDVRPVPAATLEDLDLDLLRRVYLPSFLPAEMLERNQRTIEQQLASVRLATPEPETRPTVLGILVAGQDPREYLPGAYIQFLRIEGHELADPIAAEHLISGPLPDLLRRLDEVFDSHISVSVHLTTSAVEIRRPDYPIVALQQLARNAVLHRNYEGTNAPVRIYWFSDRIEIHNPGGPYGQVNQANFGQPGVTDYRNPHLAEAMKNLGYVQRFGVGIPLARRELAKNGNPAPDFHPTDTHVLVILRRRA